MKTKLTLLLALLIILPGCEWLKKASEVTITTDLTANIPIVLGGKSANVNSGIAGPFNGTAILSLNGNPDLKNYLDNIREITLKNLVITIEGLSVGQAITTVTAEILNIGELGTQTNITGNPYSFTPAVNANIYGAAEAMLLDDLAITVVANGNATGEPMAFNVRFNFEAEVVAAAID